MGRGEQGLSGASQASFSRLQLLQETKRDKDYCYCYQLCIIAQLIARIGCALMCQILH